MLPLYSTDMKLRSNWPALSNSRRTISAFRFSSTNQFVFHPLCDYYSGVNKIFDCVGASRFALHCDVAATDAKYLHTSSHHDIFRVQRFFFFAVKVDFVRYPWRCKSTHTTSWLASSAAHPFRSHDVTFKKPRL